MKTYSLTSEYISDLSMAVHSVLDDFGHRVEERDRSTLIHGLLSASLGRFHTDRIRTLADSIVSIYSSVSYELVYERIVDEMCLFLHDAWFVAMHEGGEQRPCEACGAVWTRDERSELIEHREDCYYINSCELRDIGVFANSLTPEVVPF